MATYLGEIILVGFNFAPSGWAFCNGQVLPISGNEALFSLLGTTYGGNGSTTFALPDMRGRAPVHFGQGSGLSNYTLGALTGAETVTLTSSQMAAHTHTIDTSSLSITARCKNGGADTTSPLNAVPAIEASAAPLTDATLTAGSTTARRVHVTELRTRINALRGRYALSAFSFTDPTLVAGATTINALHITELRTALAAVYTQGLGQAAPSYVDPNLGAGTAVRAVPKPVSPLANPPSSAPSIRIAISAVE